MALRNILNSQDPTLLKKSREITDFNDRIHLLLDDMRETLLDSGGLGLAAPQVGVLRRAALVLDVSDPENEKIVELLNPEIIECEGEQIGPEGCLSFPSEFGVVRRPDKVKVRARDRFGNEFITEGQGLTARAYCHEIDHLNGIVFTELADKMLTDEEIAEMQSRNDEEE
ncbi:MAG: peptide deformylase [Ruminococcaceae bacterium]|nr:peptide deformylase [Oscillospiraceae bacterium]